MELFNRIKSILFNPNEEWIIIEAENKHHTKVLPYLLILALIPAAAIFFDYWWQWYSDIERLIGLMRKASIEHQHLRESLGGHISVIKDSYPFSVQLGIVKIVKILVLIVGGAYIAATVINLFSEQFGLQKDFNRSFSLVAYSFTPLCIAGVLYAYAPLSHLVPYIGLYGLYLLYIGVKSLLNPPAEKLTGCFIMAMIVALVTYVVIPIIEKPITDNISKNILIEQLQKEENKLFDNRTIDSFQELKFDEIEDLVKKRFKEAENSFRRN